MLSETLSDGLEKYRIGPKIRVLRLNKKLGLAQLGGHTGLSPALLSKIERGHLFPTLPTLLRIAMVFGVGLEHFFVEDESHPALTVVRRGERLRLPERPGQQEPTYFFENLTFPITDRKLEAYFAVFPDGSQPSQPHQHGSAEMIYVVSGELTVNHAGRDMLLAEGDVAYFDSSAPHSYHCHGGEDCTAIVVTVPA